ncbi:uroporphyrinogen-III C-methyltransferase [Spirosomataceae bacterium TFI 002]|nr:uroporphyrinogen-III C-methyltransferase [Spirosomataceae bacterium TFI 002]
MKELGQNIKPRLTLVGAGPGDPELITLKAINALRAADVVLYDNLANPELLDYCHPLCEKISVGKKGHCKSISQDGINFLIVEKAYQKGHVVRLKGGDPFIFGRGAEEINFAKARGVESTYIPGISSINALGLHDIPLTDRASSDGFWVITGHKSDKSLSKDIELASRTTATIVILMGMSKLEEIVAIFSKNGRGETPAAIVQNASKANSRQISGKVNNLLELRSKEGLTNPAVIVIGEVVDAIVPNYILEQERVYSNNYLKSRDL